MTTAPSPTRTVLSANLICLASMLVWAAGLPAADLIIPLIPPLPLTAMRTGLAAAVLMLVWLMWEGWTPIRRANWGRGIIVGGICIGIGALLLVVGQALTDAVTVAIITATMPIEGIALEVLLDARRLTWPLIAGLLLSLLGGALALVQGGFNLDLGLGAIAAFAAVVAFTWGSRATVTAFPDLTNLGRTAITVTSGFACALVVSVAYAGFGGPPVQWAAIGWREIGALMLFGIGSLAVSQILWIVAVGRIGIGAASLHMNAVPFYVMIFAFALGAAWNWPQTIGAVVVVLGVLVAQGMLRWPR